MKKFSKKRENRDNELKRNSTQMTMVINFYNSQVIIIFILFLLTPFFFSLYMFKLSWISTFTSSFFFYFAEKFSSRDSFFWNISYWSIFILPCDETETLHSDCINLVIYQSVDFSTLTPWQGHSSLNPLTNESKTKSFETKMWIQCFWNENQIHSNGDWIRNLMRMASTNKNHLFATKYFFHLYQRNSPNFLIYKLYYSYTDIDNKDKITTLQMVIILVVICKCVFCSFACMAICYRLVDEQ